MFILSSLFWVNSHMYCSFTPFILQSCVHNFKTSNQQVFWWAGSKEIFRIILYIKYYFLVFFIRLALMIQSLSFCSVNVTKIPFAKYSRIHIDDYFESKRPGIVITVTSTIFEVWKDFLSTFTVYLKYMCMKIIKVQYLERFICFDKVSVYFISFMFEAYWTNPHYFASYVSVEWVRGRNHNIPYPLHDLAGSKWAMIGIHV